MKKFMAIFVAFLIAVGAVLCTERVHTGYVGVIYSAKGVEQQTISQGWHFMSPLKHVSEFPITQQRVVFSNAPSDYGAKEHADWHIDAPANGGTIAINLTVNYNFLPEHVVELYTKFGGMDGESLMESKIQNDIIAYVKEVTPQFSVMQIYSDDRAGVNTAITDYLNEKLTAEYGINVSSALIVDAQPDDTLMQKIRAKEQAKQDAEIAELNKQTALAQAETDKVKAQTEADVKMIEAQAEADANKVLSESITPELIQMKEAEARLKHGWVTVQGADTVVTKGE
ncbi:Membrane protease subunits, stomatin/prohibitin homologs [Faecalibacterium prausnitzii SL3/3]|jgi:regulator of protease activity HflC (stomatin/prohibitin superfamily)|uniref:Membrane protease subunits, stomatin/prohibitin homologs n=1 Tax=Faecalibacterium prausnitzii SL3/3 TaxID=657322 RepID=D4KCF4_9FIRM|nr:SPFH domain-containing protein [Faecalibacterium prausnitzii]CBL02517.1 Membrane protease subunits, stomatin/prohibitin homologs [Faecalibacterium prausnitzii SL3/3]